MTGPETARHECNKQIVAKLSELVEKYPDWRFHQILMNCDIETPNEDRWYEESDKTLARLNASQVVAAKG